VLGVSRSIFLIVAARRRTAIIIIVPAPVLIRAAVAGTGLAVDGAPSALTNQPPVGIGSSAAGAGSQVQLALDKPTELIPAERTQERSTLSDVSAGSIEASASLSRRIDSGSHLTRGRDDENQTKMTHPTLQ